MRFSLLLAMAIAVVEACGDDDDGAPGPDAGPDAEPTVDAGEELDTGLDADDGGNDDAGADSGEPDSGGGGCARESAEADRIRRVLVSHPYDSEGAPSGAWEVLELDEDGALTQTGTTFEMGRAVFGTGVFTTDGEVAFVANEDGTLGVVSFADGVPEVVEPAFAGDFYAEGLVVDPAGDALWILDPNWRENGGGIFRAAIECDGGLSDVELVAASKLARGMVWLEDDLAVVAAADVLDSAAGDDVHLLVREGDGLAVVGGSDAFGDDEAIVSALAVTSDQRMILVGDNSAFSGIPNRIAAVAIDDDRLEAVGRIEIEDPVAIVPSPFGGTALVASGFGDALWVIDADMSSPVALWLHGELEYSGAGPALPGGAIAISRGSQAGLVLVAENVAVRRVRFGEDGAVTDLGAFTLGDGLGAIVGAIAVEP